jgi:anti-sigma-K factor RskA
MSCNDVQELAELYAVGAVQPDHAAEIASHIAECALCRSTVESLASSVAALRIGLPDVDPPASLRQRILNIPRADAAPIAPAPVPVGRRESRDPRQRRPFFLSVWPRLATAAALLLLLLSGWLGMQNTELRAEIRAARDELARAQEYEQALAIMQQAVQEGGALVSVEGTEMAPTAKGMVYAPAHGSQGVLTISGLPPQSGDWGYQLWLIRGETRMNGGYFEPEPSGRCLMKIDASLPLDQFDAFGITNEQRGGSPEPHGKRYMWGRNQRT